MSTQKEKTPPPADTKKATDPKTTPATAADPTKPVDPKAPAAAATDPKAAAGSPGSPKEAKAAVGSSPAAAKTAGAPGAPQLPKIVYVTIDMYDFKKPLEINSPRSLEAMSFLGVAQSDLKCKTEEDLKPLFNLQDKKEKEAFEACVLKHKKAYEHLKLKVSSKRAEIMKENELAEKKRKEHEEHKQKQLKLLEEEKKALMKHLEAEQKKKDEAEKKKKLEEAKKAGTTDKDKKPEKADAANKPDKSDAAKKQDPGSPKSPAATDKKDPKGTVPPPGAAGDKKDDKSPAAVGGDKKDTKPTAGDAKPAAGGALGGDKKDISQPGSPKLDPKSPQDKKGPIRPMASSALLTGVETHSLPSLKKKSKADKDKEEKKIFKLDDELKESSILQFLDKSAAHKERLDLSLHERTKKDLERDKLRMKELMKKTKKEILSMSQKRGLSAYKSHENLGNAKTRKIEYLYDLSRNPVELMKEKQQKEMESMMNYEIALQAMRKQREDFMENKHKFFKGEQQYKEVVFEYNKKILVREKQLKEMQRKIAEENKLYHVKRTKKANAFEMAKMVSKLESIDQKAKSMKEDREEYLESRKFMVQKLRKDLDEMKHGLLDAQTLEKKYAFLHDEHEFKRIMEEVKHERMELGKLILTKMVELICQPGVNENTVNLQTEQGQLLLQRDFQEMLVLNR
jgi:hypothetical protein